MPPATAPVTILQPQPVSELEPRIVVVGVGGAGGNAVNAMADAGVDGVEFVAMNTDAQALVRSLARSQVQLGQRVTEGLGAGANPEIGAQAAEDALEAIRAQLHGAHMVFLTAGLGGGTGTGAAPVIARAARELGALTVAVVTKPFLFEGPRRMTVADTGLESLRDEVDTLIVVPNQNLFRVIDEHTSVAEAFSLADNVLMAAVRGVSELITRPGYVNLDFADVRAVLCDTGEAMMGVGEAEGPDRAREAARAAVTNPLLDTASLAGASSVLINVTASPNLTLYEIDYAVNEIRIQADPNANIIIGKAFDPSMGEGMRVAVLATGCAAREDAEQATAASSPSQSVAEHEPASDEDEDVATQHREPERRGLGGAFGLLSWARGGQKRASDDPAPAPAPEADTHREAVDSYDPEELEIPAFLRRQAG